MSVITDIKEQIGDLQTFKHISAAFTEAAAVKLQNIKKAYERNAGFFEEITHIYHLVEINAKYLKTATQKNPQAAPAPRKLSVALTSNQKFFGVINNEVMASFLVESKKSKTDLMVIGTTGSNYIKSANIGQPYHMLIFNQDNPTNLEAEAFLNKTINYDQVTIYYPKFISFLKQEVGSIDITRKIPPADIKEREKLSEEINLIFEPELPKMVKFFETQVRMILFKRVILETDMARTAARLLSMSQAEERTDSEIKQKRAHLRKVLRSFTNAQLLETFSGIKKWKHSLSNRRMQEEMKNKVLFLEDIWQNVN